MNRRTLSKNQLAFLLVLFFAAVVIWFVFSDVEKKEWEWGQWSARPGGAGHQIKDSAEIAICKKASFEALVTLNHLNIVTASVYVKSDPANREVLSKCASENELEFKAIVREVIASANHRQLTDPQLEYVRGEISKNIRKVVGDKMDVEVLIPFWEVDFQPY